MVDFSKIPKGEDERKSSKEPVDDRISLHKLNFPSFRQSDTSSAKSLDSSKIKKDLNIPKSLSDEKGSVKAKSLYSRALNLAEEVFKGEAPKINISDIFSCVRELSDFIEKDTQELFDFIFSDDSFSGHYLSLNLVNVCILSLEIGHWFSLSKDDLIKLGAAGFLHDIGMRRYLPIASLPQRLSISDFRKIKDHPLQGSEALKKIRLDIDVSILAALEQEHERFNGLGYPRGLKAEQINDFARIVGLADVYEALTHKRPYRPAHTAKECIKIILNNKESFSKKVIKALLEKVGLYPRGTPVTLNTQELAFVVRRNPALPTSPLVKVLIDSQGRRLEKPKEIDLSRSPGFYIA
ncbi:MAG: HD domain-containing protein [Candidatus Omnitrophica bacterium]|nr:HD domain-containing protein [Candidatus Omnitrophota bacterium]